MRSVVLVLCALPVVACNRPESASTPAPPRVTAEAPRQAHAAPHGPHHGAANAALPPRPGSRGSRLFGQPLAADVRTVRLADIVAAPQQHAGHPLRVEGNVIAVCQAMGCWMELQDATTQAHVRMHGHSFFVPRDVNGKRASVQATLVAAHPPTECDQEAREATGRAAQVELDATGVEVYD